MTQTCWRLPAFSAFAPAPAEAVVLVADVIGSSRRVAATGTYRDITFVATAALVAAENAVGSIPGVFTGDGAVVLATPDQAAAAAAALTAVAGWSERTLGIAMRVARVPVGALSAPLMVARTPLADAEQWHLLGGGASEADRLAKTAADRRLDPDPDGAPDLTGLSCRWDPLETARGALVSLLVQLQSRTPEADHALLSRLYGGIAELAGPEERLWPVQADRIRWSWPPPGLALESVAIAPTPGVRRALVRVRLYVETALAALVLRLVPRAAAGYVASIGPNTVSAQVIDGLALIIDCSPDQHARIRALLAEESAGGGVRFGTHASSQAHMVCVVRGTDQHRHFLDTTVGGYWHASQELKTARATVS